MRKLFVSDIFYILSDTLYDKQYFPELPIWKYYAMFTT